MATYTSNYNLSKPEATDTQSSFISDYCDNMDKIDANLGGGGGGGNVYGAFIDPSRVIYSAFTFDSSTHTWTATEDCILTDNMTPPDGSTAYFIRIDGKQVFAGYSTVEDPFVYVKKGQVVEYRAKSGSTMKAYGITQGTNGIYAPVIYSDNERVIGVWRDNKPLYQRVWDFGSDVVIPNNAFYTTSIDASNMETIVEGFGIFSTGATRYALMTNTNGTNIRLQADRTNGSANVRYLVLQYTKTTDVAGSGNWNTDGVPTVHYDTNEQVVGTYFGKPLYEKTWDNLSIGINGDNWVYFNDPVDIDNVVSFVACYQGANGFLHCAISEYQRSNSNGIMFAGFNGMNRTVNRIVAQYTKTTD